MILKCDLKCGASVEGWERAIGVEMTRGWKSGRRVAVWVAASVLACAQGVTGQGAGVEAASPLVPPAALQPEAQIQSDIFREIDDPSSGDCWLLLRDRNDPGGPGRWVLEKRSVGRLRRPWGSRSTTATPPGSTVSPGAGAAAARVPVIHAGERLIVEENSPVVEARLEAVALNPARIGSVFRVRLAIGGKVVRAVALGPGRAAFAEEIGAQP